MNVVIELSRGQDNLDLLFPSVEVRVVEFINIDAAEVYSGFMRFSSENIDSTTVRLETQLCEVLTAFVVAIDVVRVIGLFPAH